LYGSCQEEWGTQQDILSAPFDISLPRAVRLSAALSTGVRTSQEFVQKAPAPKRTFSICLRGFTFRTSVISPYAAEPYFEQMYQSSRCSQLLLGTTPPRRGPVTPPSSRKSNHLTATKSTTIVFIPHIFATFLTNIWCRKGPVGHFV
jgi:hypothetical protein